MTKWLSIRTTPTITRILTLVKQAGFVVSTWIGQAIREKAQRDGLDRAATDEEINGEVQNK